MAADTPKTRASSIPRASSIKRRAFTDSGTSRGTVLVTGSQHDEGRTRSHVSPGMLYLTAASSHLYETNWDDAKLCLAAEVLDQPDTPELLWNDPHYLMDTLKTLRDSRPGDVLRWWEV